MPFRFYQLNRSSTPLSPFTPSQRRWSSGNPSNSPHPTEKANSRLIWALIGINAGIYLYAGYTQVQYQQGFQQPLISFYENMTLNLSSVRDEGRWWTILSSCFTHMSFMHFATNMVGVYYLGQFLTVTPGISPGRLLTLVLGSGITGGIGYLAQRSIQSEGVRDYKRALGFSGAVMGVGTVAACLYPRAKVAIYGIVPVPLWLLMTGYLVYDGFYLSQEGARVAHAGHLGGLAFGAVYFLLRLRGIPRNPFM
ncbi:rhomboid-domain-containing protein [Lindgomyces ingoldianus]|uniref:Rhomboid-domain-containing protein n=1 Tax=Lindgomyces ingoldianus TaxID=673940 RepID=A0ACB6QIC6_9PLEO|nr:rhomboid-domain-containing protein [Lindgomyces ingoldianus]KAF2466698.1 rhomboid-domain-containing protein [Lindgomyces ingoldianus]